MGSRHGEEREVRVLRRLATPTGHDESEQHPEGRIQSTEQHHMILPDPKKHGRAEASEPHRLIACLRSFVVTGARHEYPASKASADALLVVTLNLPIG